MRIESVTATWLHVPIPAARQHRSDFGRVDAFDSTLVRIETRGGLVGYGEAKAAVGSAGNNRALAALVEHDLGPLIVGEDARDISRLWDVMYNGSRAHYAIRRGHVFPALGRRGITLSAIGGHRHGALGPARKIAGGPGVAPARRAPAGDDAGLCVGRVGTGGSDRRRAARLRRSRALQGGEDAGGHRRRRGRRFGAPRARRPRRPRPRDHHHVRCARHLERGGGQAVLPGGRGLQPRLARRAGHRRRQAGARGSAGRHRHPHRDRGERVHPVSTSGSSPSCGPRTYFSRICQSPGASPRRCG